MLPAASSGIKIKIQFWARAGMPGCQVSLDFAGMGAAGPHCFYMEGGARSLLLTVMVQPNKQFWRPQFPLKMSWVQWYQVGTSSRGGRPFFHIGIEFWSLGKLHLLEILSNPSSHSPSLIISQLSQDTDRMFTQPFYFIIFVSCNSAKGIPQQNSMNCLHKWL